MTIRWQLSKYYRFCPVGWKAFVESMYDSHEPDDGDAFSWEILNKELKKYNAFCNQEYIEFRDERLYTLFVIRFGGNRVETVLR